MRHGKIVCTSERLKVSKVLKKTKAQGWTDLKVGHIIYFAYDLVSSFRGAPVMDMINETIHRITPCYVSELERYIFHFEFEHCDFEYERMGYKNSLVYDNKGNPVFEGSIIKDGKFGSSIDECYFCCVEYDPRMGFTGNIYSDNDPLFRYKDLEVVGHVEDFRDKIMENNPYTMKIDNTIFEIEGNFYETLKDTK